MDLGIFFFDTADIYDYGRAESALGHALRQRPRDSWVVATKAYFPMSKDPADRGLSRQHLFKSIEGSLRRLETDYVELFQCHRFDRHTPLEETVQAMGELVQSGKISAWGTSCWSPEQIRQARDLATQLGVSPPQTEQPRFNLLQRDAETEGAFMAAEEWGLRLLFYSPLAQGILTGKYATSIQQNSRMGQSNRLRTSLDELAEDPATRAQVLALQGLATQAGMTLTTLSIAWILRQRPQDIVLLGASRPEQLTDTAAAPSVPWPDGLDSAIEEAVGFPSGG